MILVLPAFTSDTFLVASILVIVFLVASKVPMVAPFRKGALLGCHITECDLF